MEAFICDIFLVVFIFKKASKTEFCIDGQYNSVCNFPFFFREKERELKTLLCWRALEPRLERYETEIKFRHKMCFTFSWRAKIWIHGEKFMGGGKLREWMMDKNFVFLLLAHSHFHFRRSVFSSLLCKAYFSENGENGKSIKWTGTTGKTLT